MAKRQDLPGFEKKRKVLFSDRSSEQQMRETGRQFMEAGRYDDALEFLDRCGAEDLTREVAREALEQGNTALYMRVKRVLDEEVAEEEWTALAKNAEARGLHSMAYMARRKAGHEEEAERLRQEVPGLTGPDDEAEGPPMPEEHEED